MDTYKIIKGFFIAVFSVSAVALCTGCDEGEPIVVSREKYNELLQEYNNLKQNSIETIEANEKARITLNNIMSELNTLSGNTSSLSINVETGNANDNKSTAERISKSINDIKKRLNAIPTDRLDKNTLETIKNLRKTIQLNEQEIKRLKTIITEKEIQIKELDSELTNTNELLEHALLEINNSDKEQWMFMGDELVRVADLLPNVKGHGNMKNIKKVKLIVLQRAIEAYKKAQLLGDINAASKIRATEKKYRVVKNK